MRRLVLTVVLCLIAVPIWADYGLSNVVTRQIDRGQKAVQPPALTDEVPAPAPVQTPAPLTAAKAPEEKAHQFKKTSFYPYTIHISSWKGNKDALAVYRQKFQKLEGVFISKIDLGESGIWYRIDLGIFHTNEEATSRMKDLQAKAVIDTESFIGSTVPYTIEIGIYEDRAEAKKVSSRLRGKGYLPYVIKEGDAYYRVLIGAYPDRKSAASANEDLVASGMQTKITKR